MYNAGLILEGGGMRGVYTAGVLDAFLDAGIEFSSVYGVSAGSCHACSYLSKQRGRAFRVNVDYLDDPNYCGAKTFLKTGNVFGPEMLTDVETGAARYLRVRDLRKQMWMIRSSSSLPLVSKTIVVKGHKLLDGGIADSIPIRKSIEDGNEKNVVILTRDHGYRKAPNKLMPIMRLRYPKYKEFLHAMETRHVRYNETIDFLEEQEKEGKVFIIRPEAKVEVGRIEKDKAKLTVLYKQGLHDGEKAIEAMKEYLEK